MADDRRVRWKQIAAELHADIVGGGLPLGARLPSEPELVSRFNAHRHTVRRAVGELARRGLIRVEQGRGSFVHDGAIDYAVGRRTSVEANLLGANRAFRGRLLGWSEEPAAANVALALGLKGQAARVLVVDTLNEADGVPISIVRHHLPARRFADFPDAYRDSGGSMTAALAACGVPDFMRVRTRIGTRLPTVDEARLLRQPVVLPVLISEATDAELDGAPVKHSLARFACERIHLVLET